MLAALSIKKKKSHCAKQTGFIWTVGCLVTENDSGHPRAFPSPSGVSPPPSDSYTHHTCSLHGVAARFPSWAGNLTLVVPRLGSGRWGHLAGPRSSPAAKRIQRVCPLPLR